MNDPGLITRYLDCGVGGIKVPHVEDAKTARAMLDVVRYARPQDHADKIVVIMSNPAAIVNIGEIAEVPGIDVINIGTNDVAAPPAVPASPSIPRSSPSWTTRSRHPQRPQDGGPQRDDQLGKTHAVFLGKGVRWFNVHVNTFITRGANQYTELLKRSGG